MDMSIYPGITSACGNDITWGPHDEMTDGAHHPVTVVHQKWTKAAVEFIASVKTLHVSQPEGLIPVCKECGNVWPCATVNALGELK